jgi:hypothetical protein
MMCVQEDAHDLFKLLEEAYPFSETLYAGWTALSPEQRRAFALTTIVRRMHRAIDDARNSPRRYSVRAFALAARAATIVELPLARFSDALENAELAAKLIRVADGRGLEMTDALTWSVIELFLRCESFVRHNRGGESLHTAVTNVCVLAAAFASYNGATFNEVLVEVRRKARKAAPANLMTID